MTNIKEQHLAGLLLALQYCTKYEDKMFLQFMIRKAVQDKDFK